jgi:hypothetical protein
MEPIVVTMITTPHTDTDFRAAESCGIITPSPGNRYRVDRRWLMRIVDFATVEVRELHEMNLSDVPHRNAKADIVESWSPIVHGWCVRREQLRTTVLQ